MTNRAKTGHQHAGPSDNIADSTNLGSADVDNLGKALLTLAMEVWVLKDRQRVLEDALAERGVLPQDVLNEHAPSAAQLAQLDTERETFIAELLSALEQDQ
jgi:hypothetical protein